MRQVKLFAQNHTNNETEWKLLPVVIPEVKDVECQPSQSQTNKIYAQWIELPFGGSKAKGGI